MALAMAVMFLVVSDMVEGRNEPIGASHSNSPNDKRIGSNKVLHESVASVDRLYHKGRSMRQMRKALDVACL